MRSLILVALLPLLSVTALATPTTRTADDYNAVAYFTSGLIDGVPVDRIDTAYLTQDYIVLYVDWDHMGMRAYRTEVRIIDPKGNVVGKIRNTILPSSGRYYTYYYFRPDSNDPPGDWTYRMYVDGRNAFEARIPVLATE